MKSCPACQRAYPDDTLVYCLNDGSALRLQYNPEATVPSPFLGATNPVQTRTQPLHWAQQPPQRNNPWLLYSVIALLIVAIVGGIVIWLQSGKSARQPVDVSESPAPQNATNPNQPEVSGSNDNQQDNENSGASIPNINSDDIDDTSSEMIPTAQQLVGLWRSRVTELGETFDVTFTAHADGTYQYSARNRLGQISKQNGTWQYSNGMLYQTFANGASGRGSVEWIDHDTFELTIIDNGVPAYNGVKRRYHRAE